MLSGVLKIFSLYLLICNNVKQCKIKNNKNIYIKSYRLNYFICRGLVKRTGISKGTVNLNIKKSNRSFEIVQLIVFLY